MMRATPLLLAAALLASCGRAETAPGLGDHVERGAAAGFNVLLITLDTTRVDRLGCYGSTKGLTPNIDGLARHGVLFADAVTSVPLTLPSHASLLTGRYPPAIGVRDNGAYRLTPDHVTLAERLRGQGYATAAFVSCFVLDRRFGLDQGFDVYDFRVADTGRRDPNALRHERPADQVTDAALAWLAQPRAGAPFFAWVHYFDPHHPYASPLAAAGAFAGDPYDGEIAYVDQELGRLLAGLDELGLRDRTLIVLASDHGEALREHGEVYHGIFIYEATMRAALLLSNPVLFDGPVRLDGGVVGLVDVVPTLAAVLGLPAPEPVDGMDLVARSPGPDRAVYLESYHPAEGLGCAPLYGLRRHRDKYILAPTAEYYDLRRDPGEQVNLYETDTDAPDVLGERLAALMASMPAAAGGRTVTDAERRRLESLGYVGAAYAPAAGDLPDPKDRIALINRMKEVGRLTAQGQLAEALALAESIHAACDGYEDVVHRIASLHGKMGHPEEAIAVLEAYAARHPSTNVYHHLALRLKALGRWDEFERALDAAERLDTDGRGSVPMLRGDGYFQRGRYAEALQQYERARAMDAQRLGATIEQKIALTRERLGSQAPD
jgi:choline-sulfatase